METYLHKEETDKIIGACFEVYNEMGGGFLESVYQECLEMELEAQAVPFQPQQKLRLKYKGKRLEKTFEPDFVCTTAHRRVQSVKSAQSAVKKEEGSRV